MTEDNSWTVVEWVALVASICTILSFIVVIVQICLARRTKKEFGAILSSILRKVDLMKSQTISCRKAGASDRDAFLSAIDVGTESIRIDIEEFMEHHWKQVSTKKDG